MVNYRKSSTPTKPTLSVFTETWKRCIKCSRELPLTETLKKLSPPPKYFLKNPLVILTN